MAELFTVPPSKQKCFENIDEHIEAVVYDTGDEFASDDSPVSWCLDVPDIIAAGEKIENNDSDQISTTL